MKVHIDGINSASIRAEMAKDGYTVAELLGTFSHPYLSDSPDYVVRLWRAADALVFETNGDSVWDNDAEGFSALCEVFGVNVTDFAS